MPRNLESAIGTPNVLVPASNEDRLPHPQMLLWTASLPFGGGESDRSECPCRFFLPSRKMLRFGLATFVKICPFPFLAELGRYGLVAVDDARTGATVDHPSIQE